jgi:PAS domain S-box-containing protein
MREPSVRPTGVERFFPEDELIVSKTDLKGHITYANRTFIDIAGFTEEELLGQPHSIIRHPDMPRCVFKLLWDTLQSGQEIFAYVKNMSRNGDHYWVFAHVTPTHNSHGKMVAYHSNRRVPGRNEVELFSGLYEQLLGEEQKHSDWRAGMDAATRLLVATLAAKDVSYEQFVLSV